MEVQKCDKDIEQDISSDGNYIILSVLWQVL